MPDPSTYVLRSEAQLRALLDVRYGGHLLGQFRNGATASEVARRLGEPAPRVAYHVGRLRQLGLLVAAQRAGRGQTLRAVADRFVVPAALRPALGAHTARPLLASLSEAFLAAHTPAPDDPQDLTLLDLQAQAGEVDLGPVAPDAARLMVRVARLPPAAYDRIMRAAWDAIAQEEQAQPGARGARLFTLSLMGFPGSMLPLSETQPHQGE
ncbi:winged helix-turn-helix domain-containing protein [Deinococcus hohokamensis]|uniref:Winged helix-turn-helix domain-containing protein n=1 Tax=Deinococcus hohokamensis TaxID=309883 RepID=A0ABV9I913_9DEIO